jgi:hypothetical protein
MSALDHRPSSTPPRGDRLLARLRAAAVRLADPVMRRVRRDHDAVIHVPPISVDWVRAHESRKRRDS